MRLAAPYCHTYNRHQTYPEWPLTLNRIVRTAHLAVNCPNHVGRFRDYAFPQWWRCMTAWIRYKQRCMTAWIRYKQS